MSKQYDSARLGYILIRDLIGLDQCVYMMWDGRPSLRAIAEACGLSYAAVRSWQQGRTRPPIPTVKKLVDAGVNEEDLCMCLWGSRSIDEEQRSRWQAYRYKEPRRGASLMSASVNGRVAVASASIPDAAREEVMKLNDGRCVYCGAEATCIDHIHPRSMWANEKDADITDNLAPACWRCNSSKGGKALADWVRCGTKDCIDDLSMVPGWVIDSASKYRNMQP